MFELGFAHESKTPDGFIAQELWLEDRERDAIPFIERALKEAPEPGYPHWVAGCCFQAAGRGGDAREAWLVYATFAPDDVNVWAGLAQVHQALGDAEAAVAAAKRALAIQPGHLRSASIVKQQGRLSLLGHLLKPLIKEPTARCRKLHDAIDARGYSGRDCDALLRCSSGDIAGSLGSPSRFYRTTRFGRVPVFTDSTLKTLSQGNTTSKRTTAPPAVATQPKRVLNTSSTFPTAPALLK